MLARRAKKSMLTGKIGHMDDEPTPGRRAPNDGMLSPGGGGGGYTTHGNGIQPDLRDTRSADPTAGGSTKNHFFAAEQPPRSGSADPYQHSPPRAQPQHDTSNTAPTADATDGGTYFPRPRNFFAAPDDRQQTFKQQQAAALERELQEQIEAKKKAKAAEKARIIAEDLELERRLAAEQEALIAKEQREIAMDRGTSTKGGGGGGDGGVFVPKRKGAQPQQVDESLNAALANQPPPGVPTQPPQRRRRDPNAGPPKFDAEQLEEEQRRMAEAAKAIKKQEAEAARLKKREADDDWLPTPERKPQAAPQQVSPQQQHQQQQQPHHQQDQQSHGGPGYFGGGDQMMSPVVPSGPPGGHPHGGGGGGGGDEPSFLHQDHYQPEPMMGGGGHPGYPQHQQQQPQQQSMWPPMAQPLGMPPQQPLYPPSQQMYGGGGGGASSEVAQLREDIMAMLAEQRRQVEQELTAHTRSVLPPSHTSLPPMHMANVSPPPPHRGHPLPPSQNVTADWVGGHMPQHPVAVARAGRRMEPPDDLLHRFLREDVADIVPGGGAGYGHDRDHALYSGVARAGEQPTWLSDEPSPPKGPSGGPKGKASRGGPMMMSQQSAMSLEGYSEMVAIEGDVELPCGPSKFVKI